MYKAPLEDYQFVLDRVIGFDALMALIGNDDVNQELADAVLEEAGKLAGDVIAPLNHSGDLTGAKLQDNGQVITPDALVMPMLQWGKADGQPWKLAKILAAKICQ